MAAPNLINAEDLFEQAFGISKASFKYKIDYDNPVMGSVNYGNIPTAKRTEFHKMSWMGTPIMFPIRFDTGDYYTFDKGLVVDKPMQEFWLPPTTLVDFSRAKRITKTRVNGNNGSVKELTTFEDWKIRFRIICLDCPNRTAYEQLNELLEWWKLVSAIDVTGTQFLQKDIFSIVLMEIDIKQNQGNTSVIPVEITALSDSHILHQENRKNP